MKPTRMDLLLAIITLGKVRETYANQLDAMDETELFDVVRLLDRLQLEMPN